MKRDEGVHVVGGGVMLSPITNEAVDPPTLLAYARVGDAETYRLFKIIPTSTCRGWNPAYDLVAPN
jgi:hypothetical protein